MNLNLKEIVSEEFKSYDLINFEHHNNCRKFSINKLKVNESNIDNRDFSFILVCLLTVNFALNQIYAYILK